MGASPRCALRVYSYLDMLERMPRACGLFLLMLPQEYAAVSLCVITCLSWVHRDIRGTRIAEQKGHAREKGEKITTPILML